VIIVRAYLIVCWVVVVVHMCVGNDEVCYLIKTSRAKCKESLKKSFV